MTILVLAPHADDEVLGMGGTIARMRADGRNVVIAILTGHGEEPHPLWSRSNWVTIRKECVAAAKVLGNCTVMFKELPAACLDVMPAWQVNRVVAEVLHEVNPTEVYVPFIHDLHKDHAAIAYAAFVALRPYLESSLNIKRVLAYETLSETHLFAPYLAPAFQPNVFIDISTTLEIKIQAMQAYASQIQTDNLPRSENALRALAVLRGTHIGSHAAEAFLLLGEYQR